MFGTSKLGLYSILCLEVNFLLLFGHLVCDLTGKSVCWVLYTKTSVPDDVAPSKGDQIHL